MKKSDCPSCGYVGAVEKHECDCPNCGLKTSVKGKRGV